MGDPGFISGLIGVGIDIVLKGIIQHIKSAVFCEEELRTLDDLVKSIQPINLAIQKYRMALKLGEMNSHGNASPPAVNEWLKTLNKLLEAASKMVQQCSIPTYNMISRYQTSKRIRNVVANIKEHLERAQLIGITNQLFQNLMIDKGFQRIEEHIESGGFGSLIPSYTDHPANLATTSSAHDHHPMQWLQPVLEPLVVGQDEVFSRLQKLLIGAQERDASRIGVVAMGGAGKTLLLKTVLNSAEVQEHFEKDLVVWLTVSHNPSMVSLRRNLGRQIAQQIKQPFNEKRSAEDAQRWFQQNLKERRFLIFLDDVWDGSEGLLETLGVPAPEINNSKIVVSTRDRRVLAKMRVTIDDTISMDYLSDSQSWELFSFHAFAYNHQIPPINVEATARLVCSECDGLPLAIKVIAATMAGITDSAEWAVTLQRLRNADKLGGDVQEKLYNRLRLSYDALGKYDLILQLCFLYIGAFKEDEDLYVEDVINLWIGEGILGGTNQQGYDPLEIGRTYANFLLDRCLIEASIKDADGQVMVCSMHDVLHDLALQVAENEEDCFFKNAGKGLQMFPAGECAGRSRISLMENNFSSIPVTFSGPEILSMLLSENANLIEVPARVMESLISIRVLDLGGTSLQSLPESLGCMRNLVCLRLARVPIVRLPESIKGLRKLQILDLSHCSKLRQLPLGVSKLISLRYLDMSFCQGLLSIPCGISKLAALQYLKMEKCWQAWEKRPQSWQEKCSVSWSQERKAACFKDLNTLKHLKWLALEEYRETLTEGMLGSMTEMRTLILILTKMKAPPDDMAAMLELRTLVLQCRDLVKIPQWFCDFRHLECLILSNCDNLEMPSGLETLPRLRRLDMKECWKLRELPEEFGKVGAFPALQSFWLEKAMALEKLPESEEGAMPSLQRLGVGVCQKLIMLPEGFFMLKNLKELQVFSCPLVLRRMEEGGEDWERVRRLQEEGKVKVFREFVGHERLKDITKRMGNKYWWDRFVKEMWMNFHM